MLDWTDDDLELVARIAERVGLRAAREVVRQAPQSGLLRQPTWRPGTVSGGGAPGASVNVFVDGDAEAIPVENEVGVPVADGARVRVLFRTTGGASIVGFAGTSGAGLVPPVVLDADAAALSLPVPIGANIIEVRASLRSNFAALRDPIALRINEDAVSTYIAGGMWHSGATPQAASAVGYLGRVFVGECHGNTAAAALFSPLRIDAMDVSNATTHKEGLSAASTGGTILYHMGWRWPKVDPITLIELRPWNGTLWKAGSSARLYVR